jgi:hypothetical protein
MILLVLIAFCYCWELVDDGTIPCCVDGAGFIIVSGDLLKGLLANFHNHRLYWPMMRIVQIGYRVDAQFRLASKKPFLNYLIYFLGMMPKSLFSQNSPAIELPSIYNKRGMCPTNKQTQSGAIFPLVASLLAFVFAMLTTIITTGDSEKKRRRRAWTRRFRPISMLFLCWEIRFRLALSQMCKFIKIMAK